MAITHFYGEKPPEHSSVYNGYRVWGWTLAEQSNLIERCYRRCKSKFNIAEWPAVIWDQSSDGRAVQQFAHILDKYWRHTNKFISIGLNRGITIMYIPL